MATTTKGISCLCAFLFFLLHSIEAMRPPVLVDDGNRTYVLRNDKNEMCLYTSFRMQFYLTRSLNGTNNGDQQSITVPKADTHGLDVTGYCDDPDYALSLEWTDSNLYTFNVTLKFKKYGDNNKNWNLNQIQLTVSSLYTYSVGDDSKHLFNRTFTTGQYFYCKGCKKLYLTFEEGSGNNSIQTDSLSYVTLEKTVIYLGNFDNSEPEKHVCQEDWISLREMIVPIVVGACLAALLLVVLTVYIIAFIRRRILEKKGADYRRLEQ